MFLADHMGKIPATILKRECDPHYCAHIPASQFGAVPGRGADMAHDIVDSVLPSASAISLSVAALFLDLEKAFDRAVREAVMGYPSHVGSDPIRRLAHLENVGFLPVVVREILRMNENRPSLLEEWGVSAKATRFIAELHSGSWFRHAMVSAHQSPRHVKVVQVGEYSLQRPVC